MHLPLEKQLKCILENKDLACKLDYPKCRQKQSVSKIEDIQDGEMYKTQIAQITTSGQTVILSLNINTDGVPVFSSSNYSIHPVLCTINNFPPVLRKKYFLLVSLWFESKTPIMNEFLKPILSEPQKLAEFGFIYSSSSGQVTCKVVTSAVVCDSVARPTLQNMNQFNGKFGCSFCLHKGDMIPKGNGMVRVYPHIDTIQTRTHGKWSRDASEA